MGLNEPVLPPFPLSDYATGELGAIAALNALHQRAVNGGSYFTGVSLTSKCPSALCPLLIPC